MIGSQHLTNSSEDLAKTLGNMSVVNIAPDHTIDPAVLFQRFLVVSRSGDLSLGEVLSYELSPFPWLCGPAVEHRSLAGVLSLSCARLVADG